MRSRRLRPGARWCSADSQAGVTVHRAEPLGFVGNTGNAKGTRFHLHFGVYLISLRDGVRAVDPVPLLAGAQTAF